MSKGAFGTGATLGQLQNTGAHPGGTYSGGASGYSGGGSGRGTYDYKAAKVNADAVAARMAWERNNRIDQEDRLKDQQEKDAWQAKLSKLKTESYHQGYKTVAEKFAPTVQEAKDVLSRKKVHNEEGNAELAEELLRLRHVET